MKKIRKVKTGWKLPLLPLPVCILGAHVNGKPNFNTIIWFNMLHDNPPLIGVAMSKKHYTNSGVKENRSFSINIPTSDMVVVTDYCGLHSGSKVDKSKEFELFYGMPAMYRSVRMSQNSRRETGSTPVVGSSRRRIFGSWISVQANANFFCIPPER